jgi:DNA-directed RNA polymerase specialized sigma24 family protein
MRRSHRPWHQLPTHAGGAEYEPADQRGVAEPGAALGLRVVLGRLGDRGLALLRLRYLEGLPLEAIGRQLGLSQQRVGQLLAGALRRARRPAGQGDGAAAGPPTGAAAGPAGAAPARRSR